MLVSTVTATILRPIVTSTCVIGNSKGALPSPNPNFCGDPRTEKGLREWCVQLPQLKPLLGSAITFALFLPMT